MLPKGLNEGIGIASCLPACFLACYLCLFGPAFLMEEIIDQNPETVSKKAAPAKMPWRDYLETEDAVRMIYLVFGFLAILMVMSFLQTRTDAICCGDWDGYYHIKWSWLMWENFKHFKWLPTFEWLPLTVLNPHDYADHHFLFHLLQIPFLWFWEPVTAAKVSTVVFGTLAIFSVTWLIWRYGTKHQLLWLAALMTCGNAFFYRMNMAKAPPLTIIISVLGIHLLFQRKYIWLLPLMFAFVWTYSLWPLLIFAALIWAAIIAWNERRFEWRPVAWTALGALLGNVINPYFPANIYLFIEHFTEKIKIGSDFVVAVGGEWYAYSGQELLMNFPIALAAMLIGYILFVPRKTALPEKAAFFLAFTTLLIAAQFRSKRFAEYFPPFAVLFAAFSLQAFAVKQAVLLPAEFQREIEPYLDSDKTKTRDAWLRSFKQAAIWTLGIVLGVVFMINMIGLQRFGIEYGGLMGTINDNDRNDKYQQAAEWARDNIPEGERIFNANWDDFPKLFFHDTKHSYVYGLDPNYLYSENPDLYKLLTEITAGKVDIAAPDIRSEEHTSELQSHSDLVCRLLLEKKKNK